MADFPCDADGMCMVCKVVPLDEYVLLCSSCTSPWHMQCLRPPLTSVPIGNWDCPDCAPPPSVPSSLQAVPRVQSLHSNFTGLESDMVVKIRAIQADNSLSDTEKARKRQGVMAYQGRPSQGGEMEGGGGTHSASRVPRNETLEMLDENLNCIFCMQLAERPVTTPCGHNFCLKCFEKWIAKGKKSCGKCRAAIPTQMAHQPRINSALVMAIRLARAATGHGASHGPPKPYHHIDNEKRPEKCFTSERAVKTGKANACSGRIFVTIAPDHFGPILPQDDPQRARGVLVGESWEDRMECRQWGAHFPHVAGIAGQSDYGAQSVALSGGYEDDEDHGEWFLYTGSGGRDLTGNKRTNKEQSFDQKFDKSNEALRVSCKRGYPVRVVRSHKEKRSSYAPEKGVRYDGIYRIEKCWRKKGIQGHKVCRYLFVRCDNEPAPWTSVVIGDRERALPAIGELGVATDVFERKREPAWGWQEEKELWGWTIKPPESKKSGAAGKSEKSTKRRHLSIQQKLLNEFGCSLCRRVMELPLSTPCGHNFCKTCLVEVFAGQQDMRERTGVGGRSLRVQKVMKRCPTCKGDITDFISCPQVNRQMEGLIQSLKGGIAGDEGTEAGDEGTEGGDEGTEGAGERGKGSLDTDGYECTEVEVEETVKDTDDESDDLDLCSREKLSKSFANKEHSNASSAAKFVQPTDAASLVLDRERCLDPKLENGTTATNASIIVNAEKPGGRKRNNEINTSSSEVTAQFEGLVKSRRLEAHTPRTRRQKYVVHEVVSDSEDETGHMAVKAREIGEGSSSKVSTPSKRFTRSQYAAAVESYKLSKKSFGGSPDIIEL